MSDARRCDRCSKFYLPYKVEGKIGVHKIGSDMFGFMGSNRYDLCPECRQSFVNWTEQR